MSMLGDGCNQQVVSDLQSCQEKVVLRRKTSRDPSERKFGASSAGSGVRLSNAVEEGHVELVAVAEPTASSSRSVKSPIIESKRKTSALPGQMSWENFEVVSSATSPLKSNKEDPRFGAALDCGASGFHRRSRGDRRANPIFNFAEKK